MPDQQIQCPIWGTPAAEISHSRYREKITYDSPRAGGKFELWDSVIGMLDRADDVTKIRLTNWIFIQRRQGDLCPTITLDLFQKIASGDGPDFTPSQRYENLLLYLEGSVGLGKVAKIGGISDDEYVRREMEILGWTSSRDPSEFHFLIDQAVKAGHAEHIGSGNYVRLSLEGYNQVAALRTKKVNSKQAFVAMWFSDDMSSVYDEAIEPGVRDAGYTALRIDRKEHNNKIDDEIVAEIRKSRFVVADFTSEPQKPRGGVYFEAGFAYGLGLPVIWTCRSDLIAEVHFDTRQYNHIVWQSNESLRLALRNRILAVVGPGPLLVLP